VNADVRWFFHSGRAFWYVYDFGNVFEEFIARFSYNTSVRGLDISMVLLNDSGKYTCIERNGQGDHHIHQLSVIGKWTGTAMLHTAALSYTS